MRLVSKSRIRIGRANLPVCLHVSQTFPDFRYRASIAEREEWAPFPDSPPRGAGVGWLIETLFEPSACLIACALILAGLPITVLPANNVAPVHDVDGSFVREWLVLGPFPSKDIEADFLADVGGESNVEPKEGDVVTRNDGTRLTWTRFRSQRDSVNLEQLFGIQPLSIAYVYCELSVDQATEIDVRGDCGDPAVLWLSGNKVGNVPGRPWPFGFYDPPPVLPISFKAGPNFCLIKMKRAQEEWSFTFQPLPPERAHLNVHISDPDGKNVAGAVVHLYSEGKAAEKVTAGNTGSANAYVFPTAGVYDVHVTSERMEQWVFDVALSPGQRRNLDVVLSDTVSISGQVLAMNRSPQNAIVVQAIRVPESPDSGRAAAPSRSYSELPRRPEISAERQLSPTENEPTPSPLPGGELVAGAQNKATPSTTSGGARLRGALTSSGPSTQSGLQGLSPHRNNETQSLLPLPSFSATTRTDTNGVYRFVNLRPGKYRLRCHGLHGYYYPDGGEDPDSVEPIDVESEQTHEVIDFVLPEIKKGVWKAVPFATRMPLSHESVYRTPDGVLWIGTVDYTFQAFDGVEFETFELTDEPNGTVISIDHSADGTLWIGSSAGISRVVDGQRKSVPFDDSLPRQRINDVLVDRDGTAWFATTSGLGKYDGRDFVTFSVKNGLPSNEVLSLLRSRDGALWIGTSLGLVRFDGANFAKPESFPFEGKVQALLEARDGAIWFGGVEGVAAGREGAYRYDGISLLRLGKEDGFVHDGVLDIAETSDGVLWISTWGAISRFDGTTVVVYERADGLNGPHVYDIFTDSDDVLWCAAEGGLSRFDPNGFIAFSQRDGLFKPDGGPAGVVAIERDSDEHFWIGTEWKGVWRSDGRKLESLDVGFRTHVPELRRTADGTLWMGTRNGIVKFDNGEIVQVLAQEWVNALTSDAQSNLWYGDGWEGGGLSQFNPNTRENVTFTAEDGLPDNNVYAIETAANGGLWVGTESGPALYRNGRIEDLREKLGITTGAVWEIRRDSAEAVWISSAQGLHILEHIQNDGRADLPVRPNSRQNEQSGVLALRTEETPTSLRPSALNIGHRGSDALPYPIEEGEASLSGFRRISITTSNGLPTQDIRCSVQTRDGIIWMGTSDRGLLGYDGKAVTSIDPRDSPIGNRVQALLVDEDDSLWVGSNDGGLTHYRPTRTSPSVRLIDVQMDDLILSEFSNLPSPEIKTRVAIQYQEIDLKTHPDKRQFWYEVKDPSGERLYAGVTKDRGFEWTPRKGGSYTFEVQAIDRDLNYSKPAQFTFRASVPWYLNAWITVPGAGTFAGLFIWAFIARALYMGKRREATRLREQLLEQESNARKELEGKNRELQEANQAKSTFLANMSHEIRTPLNAVLGYAQILLRDNGLEGNRRRSVSIIERSGGHLLNLINKILDLSKIEAGHMELSETDFDLRQLIRELSVMFEPRCREKGLKWRVEWPTDPDDELTAENAGITEKGIDKPASDPSLRSPRSLRLASDPGFDPIPVRGDDVKLRQVLLNLLGNAVKFTDAGSVTLRVVGRTCRSAFASKLAQQGDSSSSSSDNPVAKSEPRTRGHSENLREQATSLPSSTYTFHIEDNGEGITAGVRSKIFEPFTQAAEGRRKGGTGLGLTIARRQIELMGGNLELDSKPGRGSRFYFSIEFASASAELPAVSETTVDRVKHLKPGTKVRALVADDVVENRDILSWFLRDLGVDVTVVEDGEQALNELRAREYDVAFMDIRMPRMTGFQVAREVLGLSGGAKAKLVAVSASVLKHEQSLYEESGFDAFVPKPFQFNELVECLEAQLGVSFEHDAGRAAVPRSPDIPTAQTDVEKELAENPIDTKRFEELFGNDRVRLQKYLDSYVRHTAEQLDQLRETIKAGNVSEVELLAHRCMGASGNLGINSMSKAMEKLEAAALANDLSDGPGLLAEAEEAFELVKKALQSQSG